MAADMLPVQRWLGPKEPVPAFLVNDFDLALSHATLGPARAANIVLCGRRVCEAGQPAARLFAQVGHTTGQLLRHLCAGEKLQCSTCPNSTVLLAPDPADRRIVFSGTDRRVSTFRRYKVDLTELSTHFSAGVYTSAYDKVVPGVRVWPVLFSSQHVRRLSARELYNTVRTPMRELLNGKDRWLFAAWGAIYPQLNQSPSCPDRRAAVKWVLSQNRSADEWLNHTKIPGARYLSELRRYRFMLSPGGLGIQSPKTYEALLVGAVPVCHASNLAYRALRDEGWPLVLVERWEDVNKSAMERWWEELSPQLGRVRACMLRPRFREWALRGRGMMRDCT